MFSRIEKLSEKKLVGNSIKMSFAENKTTDLWKSFIPNVKNINSPIHIDLYSVEIYDDVTFFSNFNPNRTFEKWAVIEADVFVNLPGDLKILILPTGLYAIFIHKGLAADGYKTYNYIFKEWLPNSIYHLDNRPHFALMGEKYSNTDPNSEEEIWVPIKNS